MFVSVNSLKCLAYVVEYFGTFVKYPPTTNWTFSFFKLKEATIMKVMPIIKAGYVVI